jgi:hypothetical protein
MSFKLDPISKSLKLHVCKPQLTIVAVQLTYKRGMGKLHQIFFCAKDDKFNYKLVVGIL